MDLELLQLKLAIDAFIMLMNAEEFPDDLPAANHSRGQNVGTWKVFVSSGAAITSFAEFVEPEMPRLLKLVEIVSIASSTCCMINQ